MVRHQQGLQLRDANPGEAYPGGAGFALGHPHIGTSVRTEASSLSALAMAGIPSHICTARMKACHCHRSQFLESERQITVCFLFLFKVITHRLVVRKASAIRKGRDWVNYLKTMQGNCESLGRSCSSPPPSQGPSLRRSQGDPRLPRRQFNSENKTALHLQCVGWGIVRQDSVKTVVEPNRSQPEAGRAPPGACGAVAWADTGRHSPRSPPQKAGSVPLKTAENFID